MYRGVIVKYHIMNITHSIAHVPHFTAITVSLRLRGPLSDDGFGRVEVLYNGTWGTICDYGWDLRDAGVVCRQLGYKDAARAVYMNQVSSGSGRIWLQNVECTGSERDIASCFHRGWGDTYCSHSRDVGVECSTTGKASNKLIF